MMQEIVAQVQSVEFVTQDVVKLVLKLKNPETIEFQAGQFIMMQIPSQEGVLISRLYSIASSPAKNNELVFFIKIVMNGKATAEIKGLKAGQEIFLKGPNGVFTLKDDGRKNVLMIANGVGVTPFLSMMQYLSDSHDTRPCTLLWGVRGEYDIFCRHEFDELSLDIRIALSRPEESWQGLAGRVTTIMETFPFDLDNTAIYLCGSKVMIQEVREILAKRGFDEQFIYNEKFY